MMSNELQVGDVVRCLSGSIDDNSGSGQLGHVEGFARFSRYHPREAYVCFGGEDGRSRSGWFWVTDLEKQSA